MSIYKNALSLLVMQGVSYIIPLVTLPYLTHILGDYRYGMLSTALTFVQYIVLITDFGFNLSITKQISENKNNILFINEIFWNTILSKILLFLVGFVLSLIIIFSIPQYQPIVSIYLCFVPQMVGSIFFPVWLFQGVERIKAISTATITSKILVIPLLFLYVKKPNDINSAAFILALPLLFSALFSIKEIKKIGISFPKNILIRNILNNISKSFHYFIGNIAISVYTLSTPLILSLVNSYQQVGYYAAADKLRVAMLGIFIILGQAIYPRAVFLRKSNKINYFLFIKKLIINQVLLCTAASILFYFFVPMIAPILLGKSFSNIGLMIKVMSPMIVIIPLSVILANCVILPNNRVRSYAIIPWITAIIHIPYAWILCKFYGALGGSVAILITEIISLLIIAIYCYQAGFLHRKFYNE